MTDSQYEDLTKKTLSYVRSARLCYSEVVQLIGHSPPNLEPSRNQYKALIKTKRMEIDWVFALMYLLLWVKR